MIFYFVVIILIELILFSLILYLKKDFQWLITGRDLSIKIDRKLAKSFLITHLIPILVGREKKTLPFQTKPKMDWFAIVSPAMDLAKIICLLQAILQFPLMETPFVLGGSLRIQKHGNIFFQKK